MLIQSCLHSNPGRAFMLLYVFVTVDSAMPCLRSAGLDCMIFNLKQDLHSSMSSTEMHWMSQQRAAVVSLRMPANRCGGHLECQEGS